jgi:hypothetical protein
MSLATRYHRQLLRSIVVAMTLWVSLAAHAADDATTAGASPVSLEVYKSPTCGCCGKWLGHVESQGFTTIARDTDELDAIKAKLGIGTAYRSCHTAISPEGFVFEGHVPAKFIRRFLDEKPAGAIGLAVPGMPAGSPGMEVGDRFMPYEVVLLKDDGTAERFAFVGSPADQAP